MVVAPGFACHHQVVDDARLAVRARLRRSWRGVLGLAVLGGLGLGVTLACIAGASRTDTAFDRFVTASNPGELEIGFDEDIPLDERAALVDRVRALPQVERATSASWVFHTSPDGTRDDVFPTVALDDAFAHDLYVPRVIEGRLPDPRRADEIFLNERAADHLDLGPGDTLDLVGVPAEQMELFFTNEPLDGEPRTFTVTGVARFPEDLEAGSGSRNAYFTPAYWEETVGDLALFGPSVVVDVKPGQRAAFEAAAAEFLPPSAINDVADTNDVSVGDATHVQTVALELFATVLALATLIFVGLGYSREVRAAEEDTRPLRALGMDRRRRGVVIAVPAIVAAVVAGLLAIVIAVALSPLFPFGLAGRAEPDPGLQLDAVAVVGGAALATGVLAAIGSLLTFVRLHRPASTRASAERPLPLPLVPSIGVGLATRPGRGSRTTPVRSVIATGVIGVALVVATLTFGYSLERLVSEPARYGWNVDVIFGSSDDPDTFDEVAPGLEDDEQAGEWAVASVVDLAAEDTTVTVMGLESVEGQIGPVIIEGRAPAGPGEIALGRTTLDDLGRSIGDDVAVEPVDGGQRSELRIVGMSVLPAGDHDFPGGLGSGGVMTLDGLSEVAEAPRNVYLVRLADGLDPEAILAELGPGNYGPSSDPKIDNLDQASSVIPALVAAIAVVAVVALGHALVVTVRRRRHDLALLGSLGLRPRQLTAIVLWQAAVIGAIAVVLGAPLGVVVAQLAWGGAARELGVADDIAVLAPWAFVAVAAGVLAVTLLLAVGPAVSAARTRPAEALRAE